MPNFPMALENQDNVNQILKENISQVAVVMVPLPAQGHINQLLHLSRLISAYNLPVHYVGTTTLIRQARSRVDGWDPSNIHFQEFPTPSFSNPPPNPDAPTKFPVQIIPSVMAATHLRRPINEFVNELSTKNRRVIVIYDYFMSYVVQDIDSVPNTESHCFWCASAFTSFCRELDHAAGKPKPVFPPEVDEILKETPSFEGCIAPEFSEFAYMQFTARNVSSGEIYDSNREIEGLFFDLIGKVKGIRKENIFGLGPFNPVSIEKNSRKISDRHKCLDWLDEQERDSVIYVSFGSTTSLSDEEIKAIAFGLERSEQKFIWVLREADKGNVFAGEDQDNRKLDGILPEGFEERVKENGIIVRDWAPQLEILGHPSTGGFLSHCGWNSSMESISMGVPIVAWPMHSDQPRNAILLTKVLKIGVEVMKWERRRRGEVVSGGTVEKAVRKMMETEEGVEMRRRAKELRENVRKSLAEGGTTRLEIDSFIAGIITRSSC